MTDHESLHLDHLHDAFGELERRADDATSDGAGRPAVGAPRNRTRLALVAASSAAVLAVALGVGYAVGHGRGASHHDGSQPGGNTHPAVASTSARPPHRQPSPLQQHKIRTHPHEAVAGSALPGTAADLADTLRTILGHSATFTYEAPAGKDAPVIAGTLTKDGHSGGFDLQTADGSPGDDPICEDADTTHCVVTHRSDGSSVSVGHEPLQGGGTLYLVNFVRADGGSLLMHVSNASDPKGGGQVESPTPPLTEQEIVDLLADPRW